MSLTKYLTSKHSLTTRHYLPKIALRVLLPYMLVQKAAVRRSPVSEITKNMFAVLSDNGRRGETQGAIESFNELVSKYKGELEVVVTSAAPLLKDVSSWLETILEQSQAAQQAKSLKITNKVNPSVLGGIIVDFGDKSIDLSVSSRVNKLNNILQRMFYSSLCNLASDPRTKSV
ncbi:ATP synthase delta subunit-domain-containing protein [Suillus paluster]|uniref:ATP synthase delta subunit-domain-containing protein n=1 Tax=Suillus paluster TaxID=48578 RepID=UPI001B87F9A8|nr:ATP synthase delta subunit-domain-containing protein [Suillus paluster]KAG1747245.1 ATP synthase delta subunit-domain-containing protein [Suillus paluster]